MFAELPSTSVRWTDPRLRGGWLAALAAALVALAFLPKSFTNNDEYYYAGQARVLTQGRLAPVVGDPLLVPLEPPAQAFRYPVAWPAVLAVGRFFSIRAMYVVVLLIHLLGGAAVARMMVRRGARASLSAAYLFHPVLWIYSRTLLSDLPATAALIIAMDAWENRQGKTTAACLGFAGAARIANLAAIFGFGLAIRPEALRRRRDIASLSVGVAAFLAIQVAVNQVLGGYWLVSPYAKSAAIMLNGHMFVENALLYLGGLALLPPFPLLMLLGRPRQVDRWALMAAVVVMAYLPISYHNVSPNIIETLIGGQRYIMPAHAVLLVATVRIWGRAPLLRRDSIPIAAGVVVAAVGCLAMARLERRHSVTTAAVAACHPQTIAYNRFANRIAGSVPARFYALTEDRPRRRDPDWDMLVLAPSLQSNQPGFSGGWDEPPPQLAASDCRRIGAYAVYDFRGRCGIQGTPCELAGQRSGASQ